MTEQLRDESLGSDQARFEFSVYSMLQMEQVSKFDMAVYMYIHVHSHDT